MSHTRQTRARSQVHRAVHSTQQTLVGFGVELLWAARIALYLAHFQARTGAQRLAAWMDATAFPRLLAYTTHRAHIAAMALLWLALLVGGSWTAFELVGGNYTNGLSGLMTCIIALQQARHRRENDAAHAATHARLDAHEGKIDALHAHVARRSGGTKRGQAASDGPSSSS